MSEEKWFVQSKGKKYQWVEVDKGEEKNDLLDIETSDKGLMFTVLAFVVFINSGVSGLVFVGVVRTVALKVNYNVHVAWLSQELQVLAFVAIAWVIVIQCLVIIVHAKIGRLIASYDE